MGDSEQSAASSDDNDAGESKVVDEEHRLFGNLRVEQERDVEGLSAFVPKDRDLTYAGSIYQMVAEATDCTLRALESSPLTSGDSTHFRVVSATLNNALLNIQNFKLSLEDSEQLPRVLEVPALLAKRWVTSQYPPISPAIAFSRLPKVGD